MQFFNEKILFFNRTATRSSGHVTPSRNGEAERTARTKGIGLSHEGKCTTRRSSILNAGGKRKTQADTELQ
jgi:hypothetical protein